MSEPITDLHRDRDLDSPDEIAELVRRFYQDVAVDDLLGPMFNDVARVDWAEHLPKLTAFWCRVLLGIPGFSGNAFSAHIEVSDREPFRVEHFERWLELFHEHVDLGWSGPLAEAAKEFARRVGLAHSSRIVGTPYEHVPAGAAASTEPGSAPVPGPGSPASPAPEGGSGRQIPVFGTAPSGPA